MKKVFQILALLLSTCCLTFILWTVAASESKESKQKENLGKKSPADQTLPQKSARTPAHSTLSGTSQSPKRDRTFLGSSKSMMVPENTLDDTFQYYQQKSK